MLFLLILWIVGNYESIISFHAIRTRIKRLCLFIFILFFLISLSHFNAIHVIFLLCYIHIIIAIYIISMDIIGLDVLFD